MAKNDDPWSTENFDEDFIRGARLHELSASERTEEANRQIVQGKAAAKLARKQRWRSVARRVVTLTLVLAVVAGAGVLIKNGRTSKSTAKAALNTGSSVSTTTSVATATTAATTVATDPEPAATSTTSTTFALQYREYAVGTCALWDESLELRILPVEIVSCDQLHAIEITGRTVVPNEWTNLPYPDDNVDKRMTDVACTSFAETYIGEKLDPNGFIYVTSLTPTKQGWNAGDRVIWCGLSHLPVTADEAESIGSTQGYRASRSVRSVTQRLPFKTGDCVADGPYKIVVDCSELHAYQFVGWADLSDQVTQPERQADLLWQRCGPLVEGFAGSIPRSMGTWHFFITEESWNVGVRSYPCFVVSRERTADNGPVPVTGSVGVV